MNLRFVLAAVMLMSAEPASAQDECSTVAECAQKAVEAAFQAKLALQISVPKGAVMAFNLTECPKGWTMFGAASGRVIVGAGSGNGLTPRAVGSTGGAETHVLSLAEIPRHRHDTTEAGDANSTFGISGEKRARHGVSWAQFATSFTDYAGDGQPHNNMPPFHTLLYCERR